MTKRVKNILWSVVQFTSGFFLILSPLILKKDRSILAMIRPIEKASYLSSRVVDLPNPLENFDPKKELLFQVQTRQFRFESKSDTHLHKIERKISSNSWEEVELINGEGDARGSVFLELDETSNVSEFRVTFRTLKGKKLSYPIKISLSRTNKT